jgi:hypothetical protein
MPDLDRYALQQMKRTRYANSPLAGASLDPICLFFDWVYSSSKPGHAHSVLPALLTPALRSSEQSSTHELPLHLKPRIRSVIAASLTVQNGGAVLRTMSRAPLRLKEPSVTVIIVFRKALNFKVLPESVTRAINTRARDGEVVVTLNSIPN